MAPGPIAILVSDVVVILEKPTISGEENVELPPPTLSLPLNDTSPLVKRRPPNETSDQTKRRPPNEASELAINLPPTLRLLLTFN